MKQENEFKMDPNLNTNPRNNEDVPENDDQEEDVEEYTSDFEDNDSSEDYGSSGEKYGWYNGFSDDAIDDAFEGDPDATWNVD